MADLENMTMPSDLVVSLSYVEWGTRVHFTLAEAGSYHADCLTLYKKGQDLNSRALEWPFDGQNRVSKRWND
jgi:hypothetical protein